jgi:hypothetical protein
VKWLKKSNRVAAARTDCPMKSELQSVPEWTPRAMAILCLNKKWTNFISCTIARIVIPGRERSERTRNLEIPGLRFAHPGMTAISQRVPQ